MKNLIIDKRRTGKTIRLIKKLIDALLNDKKCLLICTNQQAKSMLIDLIYKTTKEPVFLENYKSQLVIQTFIELDQNYIRGVRIDEIFINDFEHITEFSSCTNLMPILRISIRKNITLFESFAIHLEKILLSKNITATIEQLD